MATVSVEYCTHLKVVFLIEELENAARDYDKFVYHIYQYNTDNAITEIITYTDNATNLYGSYTNIRFTFENSDYLGYNPLSPGCQYLLKLDCYYGGTRYTLPAVQFETPSISAPTTSGIQPKAYPLVKDQYNESGAQIGNCVAHAIVTSMELFHEAGTGIGERYSVAYIFGSDEASSDDMSFSEAVELAKQYGSPRWELVSPHYLDNITKSESVALFRGADAYALANAKNQRFSGYQNVDFYDTAAVAQYISDHGAFLFGFCIPNNFYDIGTDGIVPQPDTYSGANHMLVLIGLTVKNGKKHWIAQNSWGQAWGDGGRCYIPYDWGCGVLAPTTNDTKGLSSWTLECYAVFPPSSVPAHPNAPVIDGVMQISGQKSLSVSWSAVDGADTYMVYATPPEDYHVYKKTTITGTNAIINVDGYGNYGVMVLALAPSTRVCSGQSYMVYCTLTEENTRPADFSWAYVKTQGGDINLTASEWISFCNCVVNFLSYTGNLNTNIGSNDFGLSQNTTYYELALKSKESAIKGSELTANAFNYIRYVIGSINGVGTGIAAQHRGDDVTAALLNTIVQKMNLIE